MKKWLGITLASIMIGLGAWIIMDDSHPSAPTFSIKNLQGETIDNSRLQGKVTLINFWFPSCPKCVTEMPKLIKMAQDYQGKNLQILAIAVPYDPLSHVQEYAKKHALPFDVMYDEHKTIAPLFVKTDLYPSSILLNHRGEIVQQFVGEPDFQALYQVIDQKLAKIH